MRFLFTVAEAQAYRYEDKIAKYPMNPCRILNYFLRGFVERLERMNFSASASTRDVGKDTGHQEHGKECCIVRGISTDANTEMMAKVLAFVKRSSKAQVYREAVAKLFREEFGNKPVHQEIRGRNMSRSRLRSDLVWLLSLAFIVNFAVIYGRKMPVGANGGDTIIHMAMIRGIYLGRNPFLDQHYNVPPNWYSFLYHSLIAFLAKLTHLSIWVLMIWTPLISAVFMVFVWYKLGEELDKKYGGLLLGSLSFLALKSQLFPNPKALIPIFLPSFYLMILQYQKTNSRRYAVFAGVLLAAMLWTHYNAIFSLIGAFGLWALLKIKQDKNYLLIALIGVLLFLPFVLNIILHVEPGATMSVEDIKHYWEWDDIWSRLESIIPAYWILLLWILGLWAMYNRKNKFDEFILTIILGIWIMRILPEYLGYFGIKVFSTRFVIPLHYTYLVVYLSGLEYLGNWITSKRVLSYSVALILVVYGSLSFIEYNYNCFSAEYTYKNFEDLGGNYTIGIVKVSGWIRGNTKRDDYLIGHPYTLEWISGFTGRPVVAVTYGHGNPFLNMKQRREDIREFFTNPGKRAEIIKRYGIKYVVLDPFIEKEYNVTVKDLSYNFRVVFHWWRFYVLEVEK